MNNDDIRRIVRAIMMNIGGEGWGLRGGPCSLQNLQSSNFHFTSPHIYNPFDIICLKHRVLKVIIIQYNQLQ